MLDKLFKVLVHIGLVFSMISFVYVPAVIEEGHFIGGFVLLIIAIIVGLVSAVYVFDPNDN